MVLPGDLPRPNSADGSFAVRGRLFIQPAPGDTDMQTDDNTTETLAVVDAYYQAGVNGRLEEFAPYLHPAFSTTAPNYLPWGGTHEGAGFFRDQVLPNLPDVLDFGRFSYDTFFANGDKAVALINIGLTGRDEVIKISEHWTVRDGKATSIWVAYFEPQALLDSLKIPHGLSTG